jgi:hypothetical protein
MARHPVDPDWLWKRLRDPEIPIDVLDQLAAFGEVMVAEVQARNETIEAKVQNMIGWTSAAMAVLLAAMPTTASKPTAIAMVALVIAGGIAALVALVFGARALLMRSWKWPSQQEWFWEPGFTDARQLRRYHLTIWLDTHEEHARRTQAKADAFKVAQAAFIVMSIAVGTTLLTSAVTNWIALFH